MSHPTVFPDAEALAQGAAQLIARSLASGTRTLVLAGGSTPRRCYEILATMGVAWGRITILFGDERCVPPDDPESNFHMAHQVLLGRVFPATISRMPGELGPDEGAAAYAKAITPLLPLDLVLLGIGPDGHTASLFPGHSALQASGLVVGVRGAPKPPPERITLSLSALRSARRVIILAAGADKAEAVERAQRHEVPSGMIEHAEWLVDRQAATALSRR
jgi:6-phosphogluconolactonase